MQRAGKPNWEQKTIWTGDNLPVMRGMEYLRAKLQIS